jgi:putative phosphoribosyl transferase
MIFYNRREAGEKLLPHLSSLEKEDGIVFGIAKGGIPLAFEVAKGLNFGFEILISRKIPIPWSPEAGFGAVAENGTLVLNHSILKHLGLTQGQIDYLAGKVREEIKRRINVYRERRKLPILASKTAVVVDDGLATGYTVIAAIKFLRKKEPKKIVVASPVSSKSAFERISKEADKFIVMEVSSEPLFAVADYYEDWTEISDEEIKSYIEEARKLKLLRD